MPYPTHLLPTTVVGSYPQPDWLVDRATLHHHGVPRAHAHDMWRVPDDLLEQAQDDATILAIRDMERAGIDIVTDGEIRRESYSNRFALALEGIDADTPGELRSQRRPGDESPSRRRADPPRGRGGNARCRIPARQRDAGDEDHAARAVHSVAPGAERFLPGRGRTRDGLRRRGEPGTARAEGHRRRRRATGRALGADRARQGHPLRDQGDQPRAGGDRGAHGGASLFRLRRGGGEKPSGYGFLAELGDTIAQQISIEAAQPRLDLGVLRDLAGKTIMLGVLDLNDPDGGSGRDGRGAHSRRVALRRGRQAGSGAGLRDEIPAAGHRVRQAAGDGRRGGDRAAGTGGVAPAAWRDRYRRATTNGRRHIVRSRPIVPARAIFQVRSIRARNHSATAASSMVPAASDSTILTASVPSNRKA